MNRLLYNPRLINQYLLTLNHLLVLNYVHDKGPSTMEEVNLFLKEVTGDEDTVSFTQCIGLNFITNEHPSQCKLTPKGKAFFQEDTILSPEEYEITNTILKIWNDIPQTTTHKIKLEDQSQTKTVYKLGCILSSLLRGELNGLIVDSKYANDPIPLFEPILVQDIIDTIEDYSLKFCDDYYPNIKKYLPTTILDFFMNHKTFHSEFFTVYWDGVQTKKKGTSTMLEDWGITPKTLKKVYDVMLSPSDRNSESAKYLAQKQLVLLHSQWSELIKELDQYYLWNKKYRDLTKSFNYLTMDYVDWIGLNINGDRHLAYLQIKEDHEIFSQFKAWYADKYQIKFKVGISQRDYLLKKNKKYLEGKNG